jgi:UDP-glucose:(heptosyl)LPS alpha-1,3-glucosyltransferase
MKIAFLIWNYSPSRGGQERYLSGLIRYCVMKGHEVHVYAAKGEGEDTVTDGVNFHKVPAVRKIAFLKVLSYALCLRRMLKRERYDIVSGFTRYYPLDVYRLGGGIHREWMTKKAEGRLRRCLSYLRPLNWVALFWEKRMLHPARCGHIIANSGLCRDQLLALYDFPPARVSVIYNGVDHVRFNPEVHALHGSAVRSRLGLPPDAPVALFVANNLKRKGVDVVIRAIACAAARNVCLVVVGRGKYAAYLRMAECMGVDDRVRFVGRVDDVRPYYGVADMLVLPTQYDPFANVCLEAMACGVPVITTRDNGAAEAIDEGIDGFVVDDPRDAGPIAEKMGILSDRKNGERFKRAAREKSLRYTIDENAERTLSVYGNVAGMRGVREDLV